MIYAVVRTGGKQYKVEPNQLLDVERLPAAVGAVVELSDVLLVADGDDVTVGQPRVDGARVVAEVVEHGRGPKIIVFKYKNKTRYRRKTGHRQDYTRLAIRQILVGTEPAIVEAPAKAHRRRPAKPAAEAEAVPTEAADIALEIAPAAEAPVAEEQPEPAAIPVSEAPPAEQAVVAPPAEEAAGAEAPPEAAGPEEAPKARRRRTATPKAAEEAPPKTTRPRATGRTKEGE